MKKLVGPIIVALIVVGGIGGIAQFMVVPMLNQRLQEQLLKEEKQRQQEEEAELAAKAEKPTGHLDLIEGRKVIDAPDVTTVDKKTLGPPGSLSFDNDEVRRLTEELTRRLENAKKREQQLDAYQRRLQAEWEELAKITNLIEQAKLDMQSILTKNRTVIQQQETNMLVAKAQIYTNMKPDQASLLLNQMDASEIARIMFFMHRKQQSSLIEQISSIPDGGMEKAMEIDQKFSNLTLLPIN